MEEVVLSIEAARSLFHLEAISIATAFGLVLGYIWAAGGLPALLLMKPVLGDLDHRMLVGVLLSFLLAASLLGFVWGLIYWHPWL